MRKSILLLLFLSGVLTLLPFVSTYQIELENTIKLDKYFENVSENPVHSTLMESYIGVLEIPKISLKRGFYSYDSPNNTVDSNIEMISSNCSPFLDCTFLLASHSGNSSISYFKHLDQLELGDEAILSYQKKQESFVLKHILHQVKNGMISLPKPQEFELVLTTCNKTQDDIQDIYIFQKL